MKAWPIIRRATCCSLPALLLGVLLASPGLASWDEVETLFRQGRYDEAERLALDLDRDPDRPIEGTLWRIRLERDPETALALIRAADREPDLPEGTRTQLALEEASIEFGRGRHTAVIQVIERLQARSRGALPGAAHLLAGMSYWALGHHQQGRESFATVSPDDPEFAWARYFLGRLAILEGDAELALHYFESAERSEGGDRLPSLKAGIWESLRLAGRLEDAERAADRLFEDHPQSLAALRLRDLRDRQDEDVLPVEGTAVDDPVATPETRQTGRLTLQLAAFSDRGRAMAFLDRWHEELPQLGMVEEAGPDGRLLYKLRSGSFLSRPQASAEAERLRRQHGLEVMIVELGR